MAEKLWKAHERKAARAFGTERALQEGREGPDFESNEVIGSVKSREKFPKWLTEAMNKVRGYAKPFDSKLPILCLVEKGKPGFLVVIHKTDFIEWFGDLVPHDNNED